uniref:BCS1 N-terminal domain-containing protein n=1 Tax=Ditylenchus dipsaci TaxID=166011 RepID=A0A915DED8_9BILA
MSFNSFLPAGFAQFSNINASAMSGADASWLPGWLGMFLSHPLLFGSISVTFFGLIGYYTKMIYSMATEAFYQYFVRTLVISSENPEFDWVISLVNKHSWWHTKNLSLESVINYKPDGEGFLERDYQPAINTTHVFTYKKQLIQVKREITNRYTSDIDENTGRTVNKQIEKVILTTYRCPPNFWDEFLNDASLEGIKDMGKSVSIYNPDNNYNRWKKQVMPRKKRSLNSVILAEGVLQRITGDICKFMECEQWYNEMGVPYRRGYLLYGPPGTGKTSFITASLILLEDIDAAFLDREDEENERMINEDGSGTKKYRKRRTCVTLSGILNALDGVASSEKRIIFMTTNHKDKLDSALVRPGRVDCEQYIGHCTEDMLDRMFRRFYKDASQEQCQSFLKLASAFEGGISPAMVQRHFIRYMEDPESAIKNFSEINCVTLSGILNALDGVASSEKRIIFMTTNHKDKLDSALVRPGRVDCEQYIGHCTEDMLDRMFRRFYKDASQEQCQSFLKLASAFQGGISPAMVQRHFIRYMEDPESAIKNFSEIK